MSKHKQKHSLEMGLYSCSLNYKSVLWSEIGLTRLHGAPFSGTEHIRLFTGITVYHSDPHVATGSSYSTVSYKWTSSVTPQHLRYTMDQSGWVSKAWKRRRWPPWIWMMLSRKVFYFSVSPAACAATLTASGLVCISPRQSVQQSVLWHSVQLRCLSCTQDSGEIDVLFLLLQMLLNQLPAQWVEGFNMQLELL